MVFLTGSALADPWRVDPKIVPPKVRKKLLSKVPKVNTPDDLQTLLIEMGRIIPASSIYAEHIDGTWTIQVTKANRIVGIDLDLITRTFKNPLNSLARSYIGQVDSDEILENLKSSINDYLAKRGFPNPKIAITPKPNDKGTKVTIKVDYGYPCLLESIRFTFGLPNSYTFGISPGDVCDKEAIEQSIKALEDELTDDGYAQTRIEDPKYLYNPKSNTSRLLVSGVLGERIKYEVVDNEDNFITTLFSGDDVEDISPSTIPPEALAADIEQKYRNRGYDDAKVSGPQKRTDDELNIYKYTVNPGPRYLISDIRFEGGVQFTKEELLEFMDLSGFWDSTPILDIERIEKGVESIKSEYRRLGFWEVEIKEPRVSKNPEKGQAQLNIVIEEGMQRRLNDISLTGSTAITAKEVFDETGLNPGDPLNQSKLVNLEKRLRDKYLAKGYLYAKVDINLEMRKGLRTIYSTIIVNIKEGPLVKIGDIQISGLYDTEEKVVTRELYFSQGEVYDPELIDLSRRALLSLGIFQTVQIIPADRSSLTEATENLDILVLIREAKPGNVAFGPGWSNYRGTRFNLESSYNNIGGVGRQITGRAFLSEEANQKAIGDKTLIGRVLSVGYLEPYIFDLPINASASGTNSARANDTWLLSQSGELALSHKFRFFLDGSTISAFYGQKINKEESSEQQQEGYLDLLGGDVRTGRIGLRYNWDNRNDLTWPSQGFLLSTELSQAAFPYVGNLAYKHWKIGYSHYFRITNRVVLATGIQLQAFQAVDRKGGQADALPQSETLHAGGADTVRGFQARSLGPKVVFDEGSDNLGGSHSGIYKIELRRQIFDSFALTGFTDFGNVFFDRREVRDFEKKEGTASADDGSSISVIEDNVPYRFEELLTRPEIVWTKNYAAYGIALNYLTPLGSINLSYGLPWKRCADDSDDCGERGKKETFWLLNGYVHFNIGANF